MVTNKYNGSVVAKRIKEQRLKKNLSQEELATMLEMQRTNIANYEAGRVIPPSNVLFAFAEIFDISTDYLLGRVVSTGVNSDKNNIRELLYDVQKANELLIKELLGE